jgi:threonine synthase
MVNTDKSLYSTSDKQHRATWRDAVISGIAPDGGLYIPSTLPKLTQDEIITLKGLSFPKLATILSKLILDDAIPEDTIAQICLEAFNFPIELRQLDSSGPVVLELFHGPTAAFKDFGARFMARLFRYFWGQSERQLTVVVATSGDTGGAVANAFFDPSPDPPIKVVVMYPHDKISAVQRRQMTTLHHNITAIAVDGTFDDCQRLAKQALCDQELTKIAALTSANSINIARLIPQAFYYAYAVLQLDALGKAIFSIPSGNLGNLTGALIAHSMGFKASQILAACNSNKTFPDFINLKQFRPNPSIETISNAMDVGDPSNFKRILELFSSSDSLPDIREIISATSIDEDDTKSALAEYYSVYNYTIDPHTAVGAAALESYLKSDQGSALKGHKKILVATAHPAKFPVVVADVLGHQPLAPTQLIYNEGITELYMKLKGEDYNSLRQILLQKNGTSCL